MINLAQEDANKKVKNAIKEAFGESGEANFDTWAAEKKLLIGASPAPCLPSGSKLNVICLIALCLTLAPSS